MYSINVETQVIMFNLGNSYPECHWFESDRRYHLRSCNLLKLHDLFEHNIQNIVISHKMSAAADIEGDALVVNALKTQIVDLHGLSSFVL